MIPQSSHTVLKAGLPEPYYLIIRKYFRTPKLCSSLSEAIRLTIPWHPNATAEGYYFWEQVYNWSKGNRLKLPRLANIAAESPIQPYNNRYDICKTKAIKAIDAITELYGVIELDRTLHNVYKRYIVFNYLMESRLDLYSLVDIGRVVADLIGRKQKFDHATVLHSRRNHSQLTETREPLYCQMLQAFNARMEAMELEKVA
jgi:hypothetical protein